MAHNLQEFDSQVGIEQAWHGLTDVVDKITRDNCRILYPQCLEQLFLPDGTPVGRYVVVGKDINRRIGEPVTNKYQLISNEQIYDAVESALGATEHELVSVGTVDDRSKCFISVKLSDTFIAANRATNSVLNILWGHGGNLPVIAKTGMTVVVCQNTFNMSLAEHGEFQFKIKHMGDVIPQLENMNQAIYQHTQTQDEFTAALNKMQGQSLAPMDAQCLFAGFVVPSVKDTDKISTRSQNMYNELDRLFQCGLGNSGETLADAFNAFTDYYTHQSAGGLESARKQFESSEFGTSGDRKRDAFTILTGGKAPKYGDLQSTINRGAKVMALAA